MYHIDFCHCIETGYPENVDIVYGDLLGPFLVK
jgi:hypothetical protein